MLESNEHIKALFNELSWMEQVVDQVIRTYLMQEGHDKNWNDIPLPEPIESAYFDCVKKWNLNRFDRLTLILAIAPHISPEKLDIFFGKNALYDRSFTEFGGQQINEFSGFLPTLQTLSFLISSTDVTARIKYLDAIAPSHVLFKEQVLNLSKTNDYAPQSAAMLQVNERWLHYFQTGQELDIEHSSLFPAQKIETKLDWDELVLEDHVFEQLNEIISWLKHGDYIMKEWNLDRKLKPGYRSLFYGAPGTGKTLTAALLGKITEREVYRVDLSMIISKYIGETEKNLARIFDTAQYKNWILFFDEADSLFGKRTSASSSNDRHANQQTAYLLQRIEDYPGVVILASNLKENMDDAFSRRFQSMIHFPVPTYEERLTLWQNAFADSCEIAEDVDLNTIAEQFEIAGGAIINVLRYCALQAVSREQLLISKTDIINGIRREFKKSNKTISNVL